MSNFTIGDMIARIRNGLMAGKSMVVTPASKLSSAVLEVLKTEGFIKGYQQKNVRKGIDQIEIELKYHDNEPAIRKIECLSKPGRRVYSAVSDLKPVHNGLGIAILSTPQGVVSDQKARELNVGGEIVCTVF